LNKHYVYLPEFLGVTLAALMLNLWYLSSIAISNKVIPIQYEYLLNGLTVLLSAFIGAFSAFKLNSIKDTKKEYLSQKQAINKAIFITIRQINAVQSVLKAYDEYPTKLEKAFVLPAIKPPSYEDLKLNFTELSFLLEAHPQFLLDLAIEQERFEQTFKSIEIRNDFYVNEVQPALANLDLLGKKTNTSEFSSKLGDRLFEGAINAAKGMYYHSEQTNISLNDMHNKICKIAHSTFPGEKFVRLQEK